MSTGLTFGTISAVFGLAHGLVSQDQYSFLGAAVIASAVAPTVIAGKAFFQTHLVPEPLVHGRSPLPTGLNEEG